MKFKIVTLGCKLNFAESSALGKVLCDKGHVRAKAGEEADLVIVNTCSVTDTADHKDRQAIHRVKRENPHARVIVTGCYARLKPQEIAEMVEVDRVILKREDIFTPAYSRDDRTRCFLKVQDGCNYFCTYCTIPMARGRSRNPKIAFVVEQAQKALQEGAKEIILTGVNIGDFGRSTAETFYDLLRALDQLTASEDYRIRISSCEPNLLSDEIIEFVAHSKHFAPHFHIPLQSGSNEVLKIMHRHYTRELFAERIAHIKKLMPHAFIGVDCMVGVRGEKKEYFDDYVAFVESLDASQLHVFTYSERANTRMLTMDLEIIPKAERERRSKILHAISDRKLKAFYQSQQGREAVVLWESKNDKGMMHGFTENYVKVSCPYDKAKINTFERITVSG
ncbi:MAG: MiaB/RimO family radical SAM methylthiotransferase [Paludibacteraceae bacterium]|nr:MiaB/RimO family radical SAM methylthiotransferase [Paludibacteraceae bacterium]